MVTNRRGVNRLRDSFVFCEAVNRWDSLSWAVCHPTAPNSTARCPTTREQRHPAHRVLYKQPCLSDRVPSVPAPRKWAREIPVLLLELIRTKTRGVWCLKLGCARSAALCRLIKWGFFCLTTILCSEAVTCTRQSSFYSPLLLNSTQPPTTLNRSQSKHHTRPPFPNTLNSSNKSYTLRSRICSAQISVFTTDNSLYTCTAWVFWWAGVSAV